MVVSPVIGTAPICVPFTDMSGDQALAFPQAKWKIITLRRLLRDPQLAIRLCERSEAIHNLDAAWIASSLRSSQ
jgi:hypothetical protein